MAARGERLETRTLMTRQARIRKATPVAREQVLLFRVGEEVYGIAVQGLWEVLSPEGVTGLPTPAHQICTSLAYRGRKFPLVRLSELFGVSVNSVPPTSRVLLTQAQGRTLGLLVDEVVGMADVDPAIIARVPTLATLLNPAFFRGVFSRGNRVVLLVSGDGLGSLSEVASFFEE